MGNPNWVKGGPSANPGGRVAGLSVIRDKALTISIEGLAILRKIIFDEGEDTRNRLAALNMCLDRACGKPVQSMQIDDTSKVINAQSLTTNELSLLVNGKAEDFLRSLFLNGSLMGYMQKFSEEKEREREDMGLDSSDDDVTSCDTGMGDNVPGNNKNLLPYKRDSNSIKSRDMEILPKRRSGKKGKVKR